MNIGRILVVMMLVVEPVHADVFSYECDSFPPEGGWQIIQEFCNPQQWLEGGWLFHHVDTCEAFPPPGGQQFDYTRSLADFDGEAEFFIEWRVQTDGARSEIVGVAPAVLSAWNFGGVTYHFTIAYDQIRFIRDDFAEIIFADITPEVPHTYRLELFGSGLYVWYIDGDIAASDIPGGPYPADIPAMNWRTKSWLLPNTTQWDYIRYGTIPQPASGDFDSDGVIDQTDVFFFVDCLLGPDADGPGCRWADMNGDTITDGADIQLFAEAMIGP